MTRNEKIKKFAELLTNEEKQDKFTKLIRDISKQALIRMNNLIDELVNKNCDDDDFKTMVYHLSMKECSQDIMAMICIRMMVDGHEEKKAKEEMQDIVEGATRLIAEFKKKHPERFE